MAEKGKGRAQSNIVPFPKSGERSAPGPQPPSEAISAPTDSESLGREALRIAGHDFKTPLTTLRTLAHLFQTAVDRGTLTSQPERTARNTRMLTDQVDRLVELTDVLLDVARAYGKRLRLDRRLGDLRQVLRSAAMKAGNDRIENLSLPDDRIEGMWDEPRLSSAFVSLLSEATRAKLTVEAKDEQVLIKISGDFQERPSAAIPTYYIAKSVIEAHGGELRDRYEVILPL